MLVNAVYAHLAAAADEQDRAEMIFAAAAGDRLSKAERDGLCHNRANLDARLAAPVGRLAAGEQALIRELGGAA